MALCAEQAKQNGGLLVKHLQQVYAVVARNSHG